MFDNFKVPDLKGLDPRTRDAVLLASSFLIIAACVTLFVVLIRQPTPHAEPKDKAPVTAAKGKPSADEKP